METINYTTDFCSWREPQCSCSPFITFAVLCVLICFSAYHGCIAWLLESLDTQIFLLLLRVKIPGNNPFQNSSNFFPSFNADVRRGHDLYCDLIGWVYNIYLYIQTPNTVFSYRFLDDYTSKALINSLHTYARSLFKRSKKRRRSTGNLSLAQDRGKDGLICNSHPALLIQRRFRAANAIMLSTVHWDLWIQVISPDCQESFKMTNEFPDSQTKPI